MTVSPTRTDTAARRHRETRDADASDTRAPRRVSSVGAGAGLLVVALAVGSLVGAVWGCLRPGYEAVVQGGDIVVDLAASPDNVDFASFGWFAILTGLLGLALAVGAYARAGGAVSAGMLAWVFVAAGAGAFAVHTFGVWSAGFVSDTPGHGELAEGARFHIVPPLDPGVGWLSGPFVATLTYWMLALVSTVDGPGTDEDGEED